MGFRGVLSVSLGSRPAVLSSRPPKLQICDFFVADTQDMDNWPEGRGGALAETTAPGKGPRAGGEVWQAIEDVPVLVQESFCRQKHSHRNTDSKIGAGA